MPSSFPEDIGNFSIILGKMAQRAIGGNGALWKRADMSSISGCAPHSAPIREMATCGPALEENRDFCNWDRDMARCGLCRTGPVKPAIRPTRVKAGTNISRHKNWQQLKLWTFVPLCVCDTPRTPVPPLYRCDPRPPSPPRGSVRRPCQNKGTRCGGVRTRQLGFGALGMGQIATDEPLDPERV
jgi:hypothetical protein